MNLIQKILIPIVILFILNATGIVLVSCDSLSSTLIIICFMVELLCVISWLLYFYLLRPLNKLLRALDGVNFDNESIDLSGLDLLKEEGFSELVILTQKYKYLIDVITDRISRCNTDVYKDERDELTGLYNTARLDKVKSKYELQRSIFLIFLGVNNLEKMNVTFGVEASNALLRHATDKLKFWQDYGDIYRVGADEFVVVLTNKQQDYCQGLLDGWYPTVGFLNRESDGFRCSLAYGISHRIVNCNFDDSLKEAEERMYMMKMELKSKCEELPQSEEHK